MDGPFFVADLLMLKALDGHDGVPAFDCLAFLISNLALRLLVIGK